MKIILSLFMMLIFSVNIFSQDDHRSFSDIVKAKGDTIPITFEEVMAHDMVNPFVRYYLHESSGINQRTKLCCKLLIDDERVTETYVFRYDGDFYDKKGERIRNAVDIFIFWLCLIFGGGGAIAVFVVSFKKSISC